MRSCLRRRRRYASGNSCSLPLFFVCFFVCFNLFLSSFFLIFVTILVKLMFHSPPPPPKKKNNKSNNKKKNDNNNSNNDNNNEGESSLICLERVLVFLWNYSKFTYQARYIFVNLFLQQRMLHVLPQSNIACCQSIYDFFYCFTGFFSTSSNVHLT